MEDLLRAAERRLIFLLYFLLASASGKKIYLQMALARPNAAELQSLLRSSDQLCVTTQGSQTRPGLSSGRCSAAG